MYVVVGIIFIVISLVLLISPDTFFVITENMKKNSNKELSDSYRTRTRICGGVCLLLGLCLLFLHTLPTKEDLTGTTSKEVQYIQIDEAKLGEREKVKFALYDPEYSDIKVCISIPKSSDQFQYLKNMIIYVDGKEVNYSHGSHTTLWREYVRLHIEDMEGWEEMRLERDGYVVEFQSSDIKK